MGAPAQEAVTGIVCVRYRRISPKPEDEKELLAMDRQDWMCEANERRYGWAFSGEQYTDEGVSAFSDKPRPDYQRLLKDIREGRVKAVSVAVCDRLDRNVVEREQFIQLCRKKKVLFCCELGVVDLENHQMRKWLRNMAVDAMGESEGKADRHSNQHAQRLRDPQGGIWFSVTPFGYLKSGRRSVVPDPETADVVKELYTRVLAGATLHSLAKDLNQRHITTSKGYPWEARHLRQLLLNPRYAGKRTYQGQVVEGGGWPQLVEERDWQGACARLRSHPTNGQPRDSTARYWLSGIARCGECGKVMHTVKVKGKMQYACRKCFKVGIGLERTDEAVEARLLERLSRPDAKRVFLYNTEAPDYAKHEAAIAEAKEQLASLTLMFTKTKVITAEQLALGSADLLEQIAQADRAIAPGPDMTALKKILEDPYGLWPETTPDERRAIIRHTYDTTILRATPGANTFNEERIQMEQRSR